MLTSSITQTTSRKLLEAKLIKWNTPSPRDPNNYSRFGCANHHHSYTAHEDGISKREQTRLSSIKRASYVSNGQIYSAYVPKVGQRYYTTLRNFVSDRSIGG